LSQEEDKKDLSQSEVRALAELFYPLIVEYYKEQKATDEAVAFENKVDTEEH